MFEKLTKLLPLALVILLMSALTVKAQETTVNSQIGHDFEIKKGRLFFKGNKVEGSTVMAETSVIDTKGRILLWVAINEKEIPGLKDVPTGIYFFWSKDRFEPEYGIQKIYANFSVFLPLENSEQADLGFSADSKWFFTSLGTAPMRDLTVYQFEGLTKIKQFAAIGQPIWAPDWDGRLVFTVLEKEKG
jgi:hypothetical protein